MTEELEGDALSVAQALKKRRTSLKLSLAQVELLTKIRGKYLVALEAGDYASLPNDIYVRGFVRNYAEHLGLDAKALVRQYAHERRGEAKPAAAPRLDSVSKPPRFVVTPKIIIGAVSLVVVGVIVAYLGWQFSALAAPPRLNVTNPSNEQVIYGAIIDISGTVSGGADVFVNDSPILSDSDGTFTDKLALQDGLNSIKITARNKLGKTTNVTRNILAKVPKAEGDQASVPSATFDGIAVGVTIKNSATWLVVSVDDKEVFHGTMLAGTAQTFRGTKNVKITTGNAGSTNLLITNMAVANKSISPVGHDNEIKRDLEFAKDTTIQ